LIGSNLKPVAAEVTGVNLRGIVDAIFTALSPEELLSREELTTIFNMYHQQILEVMVNTFPDIVPKNPKKDNWPLEVNLKFVILFNFLICKTTKD
jgi:hypothetical protein